MRCWIYILLHLLPCITASAKILYVDDDAATGGDGSTWTKAYRHLQDALTQARPYDEIWVASGTYKPDVGGNQVTGDRTASFLLTEQVRLYGGFLGNETVRNERDWRKQPTILSGELAPDPGRWSHHVLRATQTQWVLDGFLITKGNADGTDDQGMGGGLLARTDGHQRPRVSNCTFRYNRASSDGAGMALIQEGNQLAGIHQVDNCIFEDNQAGGKGGGLYIKTGRTDPLHIHNCVFTKNSAGNGGGLYLDSLNRTHIINSIFTKNEASGVGGGLSAKFLNLVHSTVEGNVAAVGGGVSLINYGTVANCIIWGNSATLANPGVHIREGLADTLFTQDPINAVPLTFSHSLIEGGGSGTAIYGKTTQSAGFADPDNPAGPDQAWGTADDGLRPKATSAAVNLGALKHLPPDTLDLDGDEDSEEALPIDISGRLRTQGGQPDLGAYESGDIAGQIPLLAEASPTEGGKVEGGGYFDPDQTATLQAIPAEGYVFTGWSGDAAGARNPWQLQVRRPRKINAVFEADTDNDAMPDSWEQAHGLDPDAADPDGNPDGDGASNLLEYTYRTHPTKANSLPTYTHKLFNSQTPVRYRTATGEAAETGWRTPGHPDDSWTAGTASLSLDPGGDYPSLANTNITAVWKESSSGLFIRIPFTYKMDPALAALRLKIRYDDGFVAYLNGTEVARDNAPRITKWDSPAPEIRNADQARVPVVFDLTAQASLLADGANVLAIHLLDAEAFGDTLLLTAALDAQLPLALKDGQDDPDNDGLTNAEEAQLLTSPFETDTDGDGHGDKTEHDEGSDPLDARDIPPPDVEFADPVLDALVRKALNRPTGALTTRELKELGVLEAPGQGLTSLEGLQHAVNLRELVIAEYSVTDIAPLAALKKLESLQLLGTQAGNLAPLAKLKNLRSLILHQNKFTHIEALRNLQSLQHLSISEPGVSELSVLAGLANLENLSVLNMRADGVDFLDGLGRLTSLNLSGNEIEDLSPLAELQGLSTLLLYNNRIVDLAPLQGLGNLRTLGLSGNWIRNLSPLAGLDNLQALSLAQNRIDEVSPLGGLTHLRGLDLSGNRISDTRPLQTLRNLSELRVSQNRIQDPSPVAGLPNLLDLHLQDNRMDLENSTVQEALAELSAKGTFVQTDPQDRIISIADDKLAATLRTAMGKPEGEEFTLSELRALNTIEAENQGITSLGGLEHAVNLRTLKLKGNRITDLEPIWQYPYLQHLDLSHNPLLDIASLAQLTSLQELRLDATLVNALGPLEKLEGLHTLTFENAQVTDLGPLANLSLLAQLNLAGNYVNDLTALKDLPALRTVQLGDNFLDLSPGSADGTVLEAWRSRGVQPSTGLQNAVVKPILDVQWAIEMKWVSQPGIPYQIYESPDLKSWSPYGSPIIGTGGTLRKLISREGRERRFYEVRTSN